MTIWIMDQHGETCGPYSEGALLPRAGEHVWYGKDLDYASPLQEMQRELRCGRVERVEHNLELGRVLLHVVREETT